MIPTIATIPIQHLASGDRLFLQVYKFIGSQPGKKAYLQSNLHGAEIVGNAIIQQLIDFLITLDDSQLTGEIWLVPVCNPLSTNQRNHNFSTGRYNVYDGKDWNRIFWDYEKSGDDLEAFAKSQIHFEPAEIRTNYLARILACFDQELAKIQAPSGLPYNERFRTLTLTYVITAHSAV